MTIFVTCLLIVTLDSIRNSCDVFIIWFESQVLVVNSIDNQIFDNTSQSEDLFYAGSIYLLWFFTMTIWHLVSGQKMTSAAAMKYESVEEKMSVSERSCEKLNCQMNQIAQPANQLSWSLLEIVLLWDISWEMLSSSSKEGREREMSMTREDQSWYVWDFPILDELIDHEQPELIVFGTQPDLGNLCNLGNLI